MAEEVRGNNGRKNNGRRNSTNTATSPLVGLSRPPWFPFENEKPNMTSARERIVGVFWTLLSLHDGVRRVDRTGYVLPKWSAELKNSEGIRVTEYG